MCKKIEKLKAILNEFDECLYSISTIEKIRIDNGPWRPATDEDRLDFLRAEWSNVVEKLNDIGVDLDL